MKKIAIVAAAAVALSPVVAFACGDYDDSTAHNQAASKLALAPAPQATKVPAPVQKQVTARTTTAAKPVAAKAKTSPTDARLAAAAGS
jgi:hypothetical protein